MFGRKVFCFKVGYSTWPDGLLHAVSFVTGILQPYQVLNIYIQILFTGPFTILFYLGNTFRSSRFFELWQKYTVNLGSFLSLFKLTTYFRLCNKFVAWSLFITLVEYQGLEFPNLKNIYPKLFSGPIIVLELVQYHNFVIIWPDKENENSFPEPELSKKTIDNLKNLRMYIRTKFVRWKNI